MIVTPTVFVVGAGASNAYGLPLGAELVQQARALTRSSSIYQLLVSTGISVSDLDDLLDDLRDHPTKSIDAFLETRQHKEQVMAIGRALIAALMGRAILDHAKPTAAEDDWLGYVIDHMLPGCPAALDLEANCELTFLTFNFDTLIEARLEKSIRAAYRGSPDHELQQALEIIDVLHIHGSLPSLPKGPIDQNGYITREWTEWTKTAARGISVVHDSITGPTIERARHVLRSAHLICFLGFGYHPDNLRRLDIANTIKGESSSQIVFGSAFHLAPGEASRVKGKFESIELGKSDFRCLNSLKNFYIFRD